MRFKSIPPAPDSLTFLEEASQAVPLVPEPEESCCVRLASRLEPVNKDEARTWLAFLRALDLAEEGKLGYVRTGMPIEVAVLAEAFVARVFGVREVLSHLEEAGPADVDQIFELVRSIVPNWERHRNPGTWESTWRDRTEALLDWAVLFGLVTEADGSFDVDRS